MRNLLLPLLLFVCSAQASSAQQIEVCLDFNRTATIHETDGATTPVEPSTLTADERQAVISRLQAILGPVGTTVITDRAAGNCSQLSVGVIINGGPGPNAPAEPAFGDPGKVGGAATVHEGQYRLQGFTGDALAKAIAEGIAHQLAHRYGLGHSFDPNDIMALPSILTPARRLEGNRTFADGERNILKNAWLEQFIAPEWGSLNFDVGYATAATGIVDDRAKDVEIRAKEATVAGATLGYATAGGGFAAWMAADLKNSEMISLLGAGYANPVVRREDAFTWLSDIKYSNPGPKNTFSLAMLSFAGTAGERLAFTLRSRSGPVIGQQDIERTGIRGGTPTKGVFRVPFIEGNFTANSLYAIMRDSIACRWKPPTGKEIVDVVYREETGKFSVLLNDGEVRLITLTPYRAPEEEIIETIAPIQPFGGPQQIVEIPHIMLADGTVWYLDSTAKGVWASDTIGLGSARVNQLAVTSDKKLLAATSNGVFQKSVGGWARLGALTDATLSVAHSKAGNELLTSTYGIALHSTDAGATWKPDTAGIGRTAVSKFIDDGKGSYFAIGSKISEPERLYRRATSASTWVPIDLALQPMLGNGRLNNAINDFSPFGNVYSVATSVGRFISTDAGSSWRQENDQTEIINGGTVLSGKHALVATPTGVYSGEIGTSVFAKTFPSATWMNIPKVYSTLAGDAFLLGAERSGFSIRNDIMHSTDGGLTWKADTLGSSLLTQGLFWVSMHGTQYYAGLGNGSLPLKISTRNSGEEWSDASAGFIPAVGVSYENSIAMGEDRHSNTYLQTSDGNGVHRLWTRSGNGAWKLDSAGLGGAQIYTFAGGRSGDAFAAGVGGIFRKNGGAWQRLPLPSALPPNANNIFHVSIDSTGALFAQFSEFDQQRYTFSGRGVYFTRDNGVTWHFSGLANHIVTGMASTADTTFVFTTRGVYGFNSAEFATATLVSGDVLDFGTVAQSKESTMLAEIANFGNIGSTITSVEFGGSAFRIGASPTSIAANRSIVADITFAPKTAGEFVDSAVFHTSQGRIAVQLRGTSILSGVDPSIADAISIESIAPNPASNFTLLTFSAPASAGDRVLAIDGLGRVIFQTALQTGSASLKIPTATIPSGSYTLILENAGGAATTKRLVITR